MPSTIWTHEEFPLATDRRGDGCGLTSVAIELGYVEAWHEWRIVGAGFVTQWDARAGWRNATPVIHWLDGELEALIIERARSLFFDELDEHVAEQRRSDEEAA